MIGARRRRPRFDVETLEFIRGHFTAMGPSR